MIKEIIKKWEENKLKLEEYFKTTKQEEYQSYEAIVRKIFELCINTFNNENNNFNLKRLHIIDNGHYKGTQIFIIPKNRYRPEAKDYLVTDTYYGFCTGCDTLKGICQYSNDIPNNEQLKKYMILASHLVQKLHWLSNEE